MLDRTVEPTPIKLQLQDISLEGMWFILSGSCYFYMGPTIVILACVTQFHVIVRARDRDS